MNSTPNFFDMDRIADFLSRMGCGKEAWIGYCLRMKADRCEAAIEALSATGKIRQGCDGSWWLANP